MPIEEVSINFAKVEIQYDEQKDDKFDFTAEGGETNIAQILPAIQKVEEPAARNEDSFDFTSADGDPETSAYVLEPILIPSYSTGGSSGGDEASLGGDGAVIFITDSIEAGGDVRETNLRSDGELVQAVSDADMGGDFIL